MFSALTDNFHAGSFLLGAIAALVLCLLVLQPWLERRRADDGEDFAESGDLIDGDTLDERPTEAPVTQPPLHAALPASKVALCVRATRLPLDYFSYADPTVISPVPPQLWDAPTAVLARELVEDEPAWQQLLPYVVIVSDSVDVLTYRRGATGGEGRLHGLMSVGFGGHVDAAPPIGMDTKDWLKEEAAREVREETGMVVDPERISVIGLITDQSNAVGRVHCGVLCVVSLADVQVGKVLAEDCIESLAWMPLADLRADGLELENWSKAAVEFLARRWIDNEA